MRVPARRPGAGRAVARTTDLPNPVEDPRDESVGALIGRLVEDGKAYAKAELALYRGIARRRVGRAKTGLVLVAVGIMLLMSSTTALLAATIIFLGHLVGYGWSALIVFGVLSLVGGLLALAGVKGLAALGGDEEERRALAVNEVTP